MEYEVIRNIAFNSNIDNGSVEPKYWAEAWGWIGIM